MGARPNRLPVAWARKRRQISLKLGDRAGRRATITKSRPCYPVRFFAITPIYPGFRRHRPLPFRAPLPLITYLDHPMPGVGSDTRPRERCAYDLAI